MEKCMEILQKTKNRTPGGIFYGNEVRITNKFLHTHMTYGKINSN